LLGDFGNRAHVDKSVCHRGNRTFSSRLPIERNFPEPRSNMKSEDSHEPQSNASDVYWAELRLKDTERDVKHEQCIGKIDHHMERLPYGRAQVGQPEIVTCGGHEKQDDQSKESKRLERNAGEWTSDRR